MRTLGRVLSVATLAAAALLPACNSKSGSGGGAGGKPYVAFVSNNAEEFWTYALRGTEAATKDFNAEAEFRKPPNGEAATQHEIIEDLQSKGGQAIAVSPNDSANQIAYYKTLNKKPPVVAVDNAPPDPDARRCYLGTDNVT